MKCIANNTKLMQFVRFFLNGCLSSAIHYVVYYLILSLTDIANLSYISGYIISFVGNFFLTCYFTFRTPPTIKHFIGFSGSHAINFVLHMILFNFFLWVGINRLIIPILVMGIAMLIQFTILRYIFTSTK